MSANRLTKKTILVMALLIAAILSATGCSATESPRAAADDQSPTAGTAGPAGTARTLPQQQMQLPPAVATQTLAPNTLLISNARLRTIPPVNAAQWMGILHLTTDRQLELTVEFEFLPLNAAAGPDFSFGPVNLPVGQKIAVQIGIDIHRPERIEADKEPSLSVIVAQKGLDGPQQVGCAMPRRTPPADQTLTYLTINIPDEAIAIPARIPLMVALVDSGSSTAADSQGRISAEEVERLSREAPWLMAAYLLISDEKKPSEAAGERQKTETEKITVKNAAANDSIEEQ